jgi:CHAT domain-containing protein
LFSQEGEKIKNLCEQGKCKEAELLFLKNKKLNKDNIINVRYLTDCFSNSGNNKYAIDFSLKVLNELQIGKTLSKSDSSAAAYLYLNLKEYYTIENDKINANKSISNAFEFGKNEDGYIKYWILMQWLSIKPDKYSYGFLLKYYDELYNLFQKFPEEKSPSKINYLSFLIDYEKILSSTLGNANLLKIQEELLNQTKNTKFPELTPENLSDIYYESLGELGGNIIFLDSELAHNRLLTAKNYFEKKNSQKYIRQQTEILISLTEYEIFINHNFENALKYLLEAEKKNENEKRKNKNRFRIYTTGMLLYDFGYFKEKNDINKAINYSNLALNEINEIFGKNHEMYFRQQSSIAKLYYKNNEKEKAVEIYEILIQNSKLPVPAKIQIINDYLSSVKQDKKMYEFKRENLFKYAKNSVQLSEEYYGEKSLSLILAYQRLMGVYSHDFRNSKNNREFAISQYETELNKKNLLVQKYHSNSDFVNLENIEDYVNLNDMKWQMNLKLSYKGNLLNYQEFMKESSSDVMDIISFSNSNFIEKNVSLFFSHRLSLLTILKGNGITGTIGETMEPLYNQLILSKSFVPYIQKIFKKELKNAKLDEYGEKLKSRYYLNVLKQDEFDENDFLVKRKLFEKINVKIKIEELKNIDLKTVQNKLKSYQILIEFYTNIVEGTVNSIVISPNATPKIINLCSILDIENIIGRLNNSSKANTVYNTTLLYEKLLKPIIAELDLTKSKQIYFAQSDILNRINLQAIQTPDGKRLSDKFNLTQLSSTAEILNSTNFTIDKTATFSFWGDIDYSADSSALVNNSTSNSFNNLNLSVAFRDSQGKDFLPLEKTKDEVLQASKLFAKENVQLMLGNQATEENLKALSSKEKSPTVLHLATHGFYFAKKEEAVTDNTFDFVNIKDKFEKADNPLLRSGLIMAGANRVWKGGKAYKGLEDGILTAEEVANMNLFDTKLVVLSACKSGLGDIKSNSEGVYGLQRAFKMAGVEYLLVSLWDIEDDTTQKMMQLFYGKLKDGKTIEEAYNYMVATTRSNYPNEPAKWASFVLMR